MVYADPYKLEAHQLSPMDVVRAVNDANLILPAGDVPIGPLDYNIYTNSQLDTVSRDQPGSHQDGGAVARACGGYRLRQGRATDPDQHRARGRPALRLYSGPQAGRRHQHHRGGGRHPRRLWRTWWTCPSRWSPTWCSTSRCSSRPPSRRCCTKAAIGLFLTSVMILMFLGSMRATVAVFFSIPLSALAAFMALSLGGSSINSMVLGGLALAFSRLIDNSVVVLENIYRHLEMGESPEVAAEKGGREVALPVLAATLTTVVVFFPVTFLYGVSRFLFSALALAVVLSLFASFVVAMTVVPLFCARFIKAPAAPRHALLGSRRHGGPPRPRRSLGESFNVWFNDRFEAFLRVYDRLVGATLRRPVLTLAAFGGAVRRHLPAVPAARALVLPAHRRRPVRHQRQGALRHAHRGHRERSRQGREPDPADTVSGRPGNDRLQHRRDPRVFLHLHHQSGDAHRLRPGQPQGGPQGRQLRIHGPGARAAERPRCPS